jgi:6-pyruvoyltetrahydropterin/6-carboxytetrahydropterin synthase
MFRTPQHTITVKHNFEAAHRLFLTPGKCENIHGHSFWVEMTLFGGLDAAGMLRGLDFGDVKKAFRGHLDEHYDHRVLLNTDDPFAKKIATVDSTGGNNWVQLPGLLELPNDPTTENLAKWIGHWAIGEFTTVDSVSIKVHETSVNAASWHSG